MGRTASTRLICISLHPAAVSCSFPHGSATSQTCPIHTKTASPRQRAVVHSRSGLHLALGVEEGSGRDAQEGVTLLLQSLPPFYGA